MTLAVDTRYRKYEPVVLTDTYLVVFPLFDDADLRVVVDGVETILFSVTSTYSNGRSTDAAIVLNTAVTGVDVEIYGERDPRRENDYLGNSPNLAENNQIDADALSAVQQEQARDFGRVIKFPAGEGLSYGIDDNAATRAGKALTFDGNGKPIASSLTPNTAAVSTFMETVLDDLNAAAARATLAAANISEEELGTNARTVVLTTGTSTAYVLAAADTITAYATRQVFRVRMHTSCGASPTINIDGLGARNIQMYNTGGTLVGLSSGALQAFNIATITYDGTQFVASTGLAFNTTSGLPGLVKVLDEDDMSSDHETWPSSQQATKAYVDASGGPDAVMEDQKSSGTDGGTATSGAWRTRDLNTEVYDPDSLVSITSNEFTPTVAGWVNWSSLAQHVGGNQSRLYNVTDSVVVEYGTNEINNSANFGGGRSLGSAPVVASKAYRVEHRVNTTRSTDGWGTGNGYGNVEVFTRVEFWRKG